MCFMRSLYLTVFQDLGDRMKRNLKLICLLLCALVILQCGVVSVSARGPFTVRDLGSREEMLNLSQNTQQETEPEETVPETEVAVETVPEETEVAETLPEETVPETEPAVETQPTQPQHATYDEVPLYFQTDYPDTLYGNGTIKSSGCSITSLAMVATYMTGHTYLPDELADYFGGYIGNNMERLEYASDELQLVWKKAENWHEAKAALEGGKVVIALMREDSVFTNSQHFVVLAGMTVDGKFIVNDPYEPNYSHWQLKPGFENGFDEGSICNGLSGAWIYDKSEMPTHPFVYVEEEKPEVECRYPDLELTQEDTKLLAKLIWLEARGESHEGQQAVAEVILNRLAADNFPDTMKGVIYAEGQFPSVVNMDEAEPTQTQYEAIEAAMYGPYILPEDVVFYATYKVNDNVWGEIGGHYFCYQWNWTEE